VAANDRDGTQPMVSGVTKGERGQLLLAQQTRGRKAASPKYFNDHKSEFDEVC